MWYIYTIGTSFSHKKEPSYIICRTIDEQEKVVLSERKANVFYFR